MYQENLVQIVDLHMLFSVIFLRYIFRFFMTLSPHFLWPSWRTCYSFMLSNKVTKYLRRTLHSPTECPTYSSARVLSPLSLTSGVIQTMTREECWAWGCTSRDVTFSLKPQTKAEIWGRDNNMLLLENSRDVLSECLKSENDHWKSLYLPDPIPPKPRDNAFNQVS